MDSLRPLRYRFHFLRVEERVCGGADMSTQKVKSFMDSPLVAWVSDLCVGEEPFIYVLIHLHAQHSTHPPN